MRESEPLEGRDLGSGEPTPLWRLCAIVVVGTLLFGLYDDLAALSFATGAGVVGLAQATVIERTVASDERRSGRRYLRRPGSRILPGTKLGFTGADA